MLTQPKVKTITHIPGWSDHFETNKIGKPEQAYAYVPIIYRALRLRCNALAKVPVTIEDGSGNEVEWPFPANLYDLIWRTEAALLLSGAAYWEKVANRPAGVVKNVVWRNPYSIEVAYKDKEIRFTQQTSKSEWTNDLANGKYEMVYFSEFDPTNDILPGIAASGVGLTNSQLIRYLTRFAAIFFEQGGMPVIMLPFENIAPAEKTRVEAFFKKLATGIRNAWRVLAFEGAVKPEILTPALKDMVIKELYDQARHEVADAFEMPLPMLENPANRSVTEELRLSFYQDTIEPRGTFIESVVNTQLFAPLDLEMHFDFNQLDIYQEDEEQRSQSLLSLTEAGMPLKLALEVLGFDLTKDQWAELERENEPPPPPAFTPPVPGVGNVPEPMRAELDKWKRKASKRARDGKGGATPFESDVIPFSLQGAIAGALENTITTDEVRQVFDDVFLGYP